MSVAIIDICFSEGLFCLNLSCTWGARCASKLKMRFCCPQLDLTGAGCNAWAQCLYRWNSLGRRQKEVHREGKNPD